MNPIRHRNPVPGTGAHPALRALAMAAALGATVAFSVVLARLTLEPSPASEALTYSNVHPGQSIRAYVNHGTAREAARQIGGNLLLGVPFGVLLPVLVPQVRGLARVVLCTTVVMTLVELVQGALVTGRAFDVDDVILNTTGALLGYLFLGRRLGRAVHPRRTHWWHRFTRRHPGSEAEVEVVKPRPARWWHRFTRRHPESEGGAAG
ncbi:VanZ family protein [Streptomyces sp. NPDC002039]|uniref:VanZ family protein n=1 Tax=unclassified Streptomyces TaxID=2593676 RepID=UPI0033191DA4